MKKIRYIFMLFLLANTTIAQVASGGQFVLNEVVIANGGGRSNGGAYQMEETHGNPNATQKMTGGIYTQQGGFNNQPQFVPTAARLSIQGQAVVGKDRGIKNVIVTLMGGLMTSPKSTRTNQFGFFTFTDVEAGYFYVVQVRHRELNFEQDTESFMLTDDLKDLIFRASPN